ncbi:MAG: 50S ribosomal protein L30 [Chloroflexi bacterium]|nr:50S ribosomal protein L30 [Chloroflexota bacterium]
MASAKLHLRQVRSSIGTTRRQQETLRALGLGRIGKTAEREQSAAIDGMLVVVGHLVECRREAAE